MGRYGGGGGEETGKGWVFELESTVRAIWENSEKLTFKTIRILAFLNIQLRISIQFIISCSFEKFGKNESKCTIIYDEKIANSNSIQFTIKFVQML